MGFWVRWLALVLLMVSAPVPATSLDLNLSSEAARIGLVEPLDPQNLEVDGAWLHHQDEGELLSAGLHLVDTADPGRGALDVGVGGKLYYVDFDGGGSGAALALGGKFRWTWPTFNRFAVGGHLYYAPSVTSGGDVDRYTEVAVRAEYLLLRNANVYLGLRNIRIRNDRSDDTETFDSGLHAGVRLSF